MPPLAGKDKNAEKEIYTSSDPSACRQSFKLADEEASLREFAEQYAGGRVAKMFCGA
jgi:hypothetical protein